MMKPLFCLPFALAVSLLHGAPDAPNDAQNDSNDDNRSTVSKLVAKWNFEADTIGTWQGTPEIDALGPQPPMFPTFKVGNKSAFFPGKDRSLVVKESDLPEAKLRFAQGETITLEAWVNVEEIKTGAYLYLIGKGRNQNKAFTGDNQNYALRIKGEEGEARLSFLFRSETTKTIKGDYHRWTALEGFIPNSGWHHVAVVYTFGKSKSLLAYLDGKDVKGKWDMGGATDNAPVTDGDDLIIGTGNGGGPGNSLRGSLDEVAIHRGKVTEALLTQRFQFVPPAPTIDPKSLIPGKVLVQICEEGVPAKNSWPALPPTVTEHYEEDVFGFVEEPNKYVDSGIRGDRANPHLLRAAAIVNLPAGKHRLLLRGRGATHLHIDGKQVLSTPFPPADSGGHGRVTEQDKYLNLGPDFRFAPPGTQETSCEFESKGGEHVIVMEHFVGGVMGKTTRRAELGESVVAISYQGSESWEVLSPGMRKVSYTDTGWQTYEAERQQHLATINTANRAEQRSKQSPYWNMRRDAANQWLASTPEVAVPESVKGFPEGNAIDRFIATKIATVSAQNKDAHQGTVDFFKDIQPLLETKCFDCHKGAKVKGGLKLDSLADALKGGKDDGAAITPHKPEASSLIARVSSTDTDAIMPPKGALLTKEEIAKLTTWIKEGANWPEMKVENVTLTTLTDDLSFLRRVTLDTVGVAPSLSEIDTFTKDTSADKRAKAIDRLLSDARWADQWMGYWQDALAENPNILNPTLNNTGPFRWWIYESLLDDKPMDLFATELVRMRGSEKLGGPAGFAMASQNDVPMAAKGTIVSTAFLGVEMKCARCHDSPAHKSSQEDLFALAAMLGQKEMEVPITSSVPMDKLHEGGRKPLIQVTLKPGSKVAPKWPFAEFCEESVALKLAQDSKDERDRLAALITAPQNERFAQVMTNRIWARFMGRGIVEPIADWEKGKPTHPELLRWLSREFVRGGYSTKHLAKIILNSQAYQRATDPQLRETSPLFTSPAPRRLAAEQIVDSLFAATGKPFSVEPASLDIDGRRDIKNSINLGQPRRSWMLTSTSNERDRPSLALPRIQAVTDVLGAFGWRGSRQDATSKRETDPTTIQPAILSNGTMGIWLTRLSDDHGITKLALKDQSVEQMVDTLFLQLLTRHPSAEEATRYVAYLTPGYDTRKNVTPKNAPSTSEQRQRVKYVSWSNHLDPVATMVRQEQELAARRGDPPTEKLNAEWRKRLEDSLWALLNAPEWIFVP